jgi:hypothetical protein
MGKEKGAEQNNDNLLIAWYDLEHNSNSFWNSEFACVKIMGLRIVLDIEFPGSYGIDMGLKVTLDIKISGSYGIDMGLKVALNIKLPGRQ